MNDAAMHVENNNITNSEKLKILLLTNRDSDNVGDQVIEACDIGLISAVMKNLNIDKSKYKIISRAAALVSQKYLKTRDPELLKTAESLIQKADIVIFGGAPLFNFLYQPFYERTAITIELAQKYNKPVVFSAIGVEGYDDANKKCQRLKKALNSDCVKQITTRDDFDALQKYKDSEHIHIEKVADPAVFTSTVFRKFIQKENEKKTIGLFILRSNGFIDNHFDFTRDEAACLWTDLIKDLESKGYDYELLTSGHFGDEAFLDYLIRYHNIPAKKCVFNMNTPEKLIQKISSYSGVVSCRLHPSIISFSLGVPAIGIIWNNKVKEFYHSIGYDNRLVEVDGISASTVIETLEQAMQEGILKDENYLCSVYQSLFKSIQNILYPDGNDNKPYPYQELLLEIPAYKGTSSKELEKKLERKFRRTYKTYNERCDKNKQLIKATPISTTDKPNHSFLNRFIKTMKNWCRKLRNLFQS